MSDLGNITVKKREGEEKKKKVKRYKRIGWEN